MVLLGNYSCAVNTWKYYGRVASIVLLGTEVCEWVGLYCKMVIWMTKNWLLKCSSFSNNGQADAHARGNSVVNFYGVSALLVGCVNLVICVAVLVKFEWKFTSRPFLGKWRYYASQKFSMSAAVAFRWRLANIQTNCRCIVWGVLVRVFLAISIQ